jgi:proline iminopeptidase
VIGVALAGAGAVGLRASLPDEVLSMLDIAFVVPRASTVVGIADELVRVAERHGGPVVLFGHSMNGSLVLATAARHPDLVLGTIAVGAPPALPPDVDASRAHWIACAEPERRARFDERSRRAAAAGDDLVERQRWIEAADAVRSWHDLDFDPTPIDAAYERPRDEVMAWAGAVFQDAANVDWPAVLRSQPAPVLLALGRSDFLVPCTLWEGALPPPFEVHTFDRSGHTPFVEQPDEFTATVGRWLEERLEG